MDYLSETSRKEKRNLLTTGFAGIIVAQLKIYPTEIDVLGLKFQSPDLPMIAVGGLLAAILYFQIKFYLSYRYEQGAAETKLLTLQIREGKQLDIASEEAALKERASELIWQKEVVRLQLADLDRRVKIQEGEIRQRKLVGEKTLKDIDRKLEDLQTALATANPEIAQIYLPPFQHIRDFAVIWKEMFEEELRKTNEGRVTFLDQSNRNIHEMMENLENEKNHRKAMFEAHARELQGAEDTFNEKRRNIELFKRTHSMMGKISPLHLFLEIYLPLVVGVLAMGSLIYLMIHFPPHPKPPSLPEF